MAEVYITGASGVIGASLARHFGKRVIPVSRSSHPGIPTLRQVLRYQDADWLDPAHNDATLLHCAGFADPRGTGFDDSAPRAALMAPHIDMIKALVARGWRGRLVVFSTAGVYGAAQTLPITEDHPPAPDTPYTCHKLDQERRFAALADQLGFQVVTLRIANVYGPTSARRGQGVIPLLLKAVQTGDAFPVYGSGDTLRDYIALSDLCRAIGAVLKTTFTNQITLNIGSGQGTSLNQLIRMIEDLSGKSIFVNRHAPVAEPGDSVLDTTRAYQHLGWKPDVALADGLGALLQAGI